MPRVKKPHRTKGPAAPKARHSPGSSRQPQRETSRRHRSPVTAYVLSGIVLIAAAVVAAVLISVNREEGPGQRIPIQGTDHIPTGVTIDKTQFRSYNSNPPTSGPHWDDPASPGIYEQTLPDEQLIHNLEHGYIAINHNCSKQQCPDLVNQLTGVYNLYKSKVIVNYRPKTAWPIALTAWGRLDTMDAFDEQRIIKFISAYRNKGPEQTND